MLGMHSGALITIPEQGHEIWKTTSRYIFFKIINYQVLGHLQRSTILMQKLRFLILMQHYILTKNVVNKHDKRI